MACGSIIRQVSHIGSYLLIPADIDAMFRVMMNGCYHMVGIGIHVTFNPKRAWNPRAMVLGAESVFGIGLGVIIFCQYIFAGYLYIFSTFQIKWVKFLF